MPFSNTAFNLLKPKGAGVIEMNRPTKAAVLEQLATVDAFYFWGHGRFAGALCVSRNSEDDLTSADIRAVSAARRRAGRTKLRFVELRSCWSVRTQRKVSAWFGVAKEVRGYPDSTVPGVVPQVMVTLKSVTRADPGPKEEYLDNYNKKDHERAHKWSDKKVSTRRACK